MSRSLPRPPVVAMVALGGVAVVAVVLAGLGWLARGPDTRLARAAELAPPSTQRLSWVDWAGVRDALGVDLGASSSAGEVDDLVTSAYDEGWSATSALASSAGGMQEDLGFSPATLDWELFAQGPDGAVEIMHAGEAASFDDIADRLAAAGFARPGDDELDGGVWAAGPDVLARLDPRLTPQLQYVALVADEGLVLSSDRSGFLEDAVASARGEGPRLEGLDGVLSESGDPVAAAVYDGAYTCEHLAMAQADPAEQAEAERLLAAAGEVDAVDAFAMAIAADGGVRVSMAFDDADQARANADTRGTLALGPAPGQGGSFADRFAVEDVVARQEVVVLDLAPRGGGSLVSDLASGPVLFATC